MLTGIYLEAHEAAIHTAKLRTELSQSRTEQNEYLKNVELARVLDKRAERKKAKGEEPLPLREHGNRKRRVTENEEAGEAKKRRTVHEDVDNAKRNSQLANVLGSIF